MLYFFMYLKYFTKNFFKRKAKTLMVKLRFLSESRAKRVEHYEREVETYKIDPGDQSQ